MEHKERAPGWWVVVTALNNSQGSSRIRCSWQWSFKGLQATFELYWIGVSKLALYTLFFFPGRLFPNAALCLWNIFQAVITTGALQPWTIVMPGSQQSFDGNGLTHSHSWRSWRGVRISSWSASTDKPSGACRTWGTDFCWKGKELNTKHGGFLISYEQCHSVPYFHESDGKCQEVFQNSRTGLSDFFRQLSPRDSALHHGRLGQRAQWARWRRANWANCWANGWTNCLNPSPRGGHRWTSSRSASGGTRCCGRNSWMWGWGKGERGIFWRSFRVFFRASIRRDSWRTYRLLSYMVFPR